MKKIFIFIWFIIFATLVFAISATNEKKISMQVKKRLPLVKIDSIMNTPIPGIYEIHASHKVFYVDENANYLFIGNLIDLKTKENLTQITLDKINIVDWHTLPLDLAIKRVIGNPKTSIVIFTDPDCPFCQRLEQETLSKLNNLTIYYFLLPLVIHQNALSDAKKILCSYKPQEIYLSWMQNQTALPINENCRQTDNINKIKLLAEKLGINSTPTIILPNGKMLIGLVSADYLKQLLNENTANRGKIQ